MKSVSISLVLAFAFSSPAWAQQFLCPAGLEFRIDAAGALHLHKDLCQRVERSRPYCPPGSSAFGGPGWMEPPSGVDTCCPSPDWRECGDGMPDGPYPAKVCEAGSRHILVIGDYDVCEKTISADPICVLGSKILLIMPRPGLDSCVMRVPGPTPFPH